MSRTTPFFDSVGHEITNSGSAETTANNGEEGPTRKVMRISETTQVTIDDELPSRGLVASLLKAPVLVVEIIYAVLSPESWPRKRPVARRYAQDGDVEVRNKWDIILKLPLRSFVVLSGRGPGRGQRRPSGAGNTPHKGALWHLLLFVHTTQENRNRHSPVSVGRPIFTTTLAVFAWPCSSTFTLTTGGVFVFLHFLLSRFPLTPPCHIRMAVRRRGLCLCRVPKFTSFRWAGSQVLQLRALCMPSTKRYFNVLLNGLHLITYVVQDDGAIL
jgi:hypothetical protein